MSSISMDSYLEVVSPHLAPAIINREALCRLRAVARLLPPCSLAGFELRARDDQPTVDFFVRLPYANPGFAPSLLAHPVWQALRRLCDAVSSPSGRLHERVTHIFIEFDLGAPPSETPIPGLFLELDTSRTLTAPDVLAMTHTLDIHRHPSRISAEALDDCLKALPSGAKVVDVGVMLSRPGAALRLVIQHMHPGGVCRYLDSIGWLDPGHQFSALVDDIAEHADADAMLDIDVADTVRPKVGVEFYLRRETDNLPRWKALFALLVERGLAGPAKTAAILEWPGFSQEGAAGHAWSENLTLGDLLFRGTARSLFWRTINHIKLSYQPGQEPEIKIYLGLGHNWFPIPVVAGSI
jgi:hypothetical protein